jgi:hypothetical protein
MPKTTKKPKPATANSVLNECQAAFEKGLGHKAHLTEAATAKWRKIYRVMIKRALAERPGQWDKDKKNVLRVAKKLGKVAAALSEGPIVLMWAMEAASIAVRADPGCPVAQGRYCDPKDT